MAEVVVTNGDIISQREEEKGTMGTNILLVKNTILDDAGFTQLSHCNINPLICFDPKLRHYDMNNLPVSIIYVM